MPTADISPGAENGLLTVSGSVLTEKAIVSGGETLLPLRAVAEALDLKVFWDATTGANVALADGTSSFPWIPDTAQSSAATEANSPPQAFCKTAPPTSPPPP